MHRRNAISKRAAVILLAMDDKGRWCILPLANTVWTRRIPLVQGAMVDPRVDGALKYAIVYNQINLHVRRRDAIDSIMPDSATELIPKVSKI